jgi:NAD+ synthase (glutamine-hydrolysing)
MPHTLQLAVLQFSPGKGDYEGNLARLGGIFTQLDSLDPRPDVLHLPESALTGYFLEGGVREQAHTAGAFAADLQRVFLASGASQPLEVAIGFYELWNSILYNSAIWVRLGGDAPLIRHVHRKNFLPTYGLFDEERFVERGHDIRAFETPWGKFAMLVCEDAWHSLPGTLLALDGATVIFISAAAPARGVHPRDDAIPGPASVARWERLVRDIAEEQGVFVSFANLVANEGGKSFPGGATIAGPNGEVRVRGPLWREALVALRIDLNDLSRARSEMPLLADLQTAMPHLLDNLEQIRAETPAALEYDPAPAAKKTVAKKSRAKAESRSSDIEVVQVGARENGAPSALSIDGSLTESWLTSFIRDELEQRGFEKAIVAISGGVDSAVTAFLASKAIGAKNVIGVRLPYRTSSSESLDHAQLVIDALGIESRTIDISAAVDGYLANEPGADATRRGNVMARMRMIATFDLGARYKALPLGTGNKTERLLGYFTWHGDDAPPINPIGDLYKTQLRALAMHLGVPEPIIDKPPTADLVHGQTDEGDLGISYDRADQILHWILSGFSVDEMLGRGFDQDEVAVVRKRLDSTHWKRRMSTVAMLSGTAIGESYLRPVDY